MTEKRFTLKSFHFHNLIGVIYDNLEKEELHLSLYEIIDLLNEVSQSEYDLKRFREEIYKKLEEVYKE